MEDKGEQKDSVKQNTTAGVGRPRKRNNRILTATEQLEQTKKERFVDLDRPGSILNQVNIRTILNKSTFELLPAQYQYKLLQLLPDVDTVIGPNNVSE